MSVITDDYLAFCEGLRGVCGIDLTQYKRPQMERRLRSFFERKGVNLLTDALTEPTPGLRGARPAAGPGHHQRLPAVAPSRAVGVPGEGHPGRAGPGRPLRAWSAGSSYGAEAFTLAALCRQTIPQARVQILGTDIDRRMVQRATEGVFSEEDTRTVPAGAMERHFERIHGGWRAVPELRAMTRFEVGDLLAMRPPRAAYELVMCRNTVIYFAEPIRDELHARLAGALRCGGVLVIGATERVANPSALGLSPVHPFIFRKA